MRRIIGMVTYLSKFLENLSALCEPLRQLTRQHVQWTWTAEHDDALQKIKNAVTQTPVLKYFNSKDETTVVFVLFYWQCSMNATQRTRSSSRQVIACVLLYAIISSHYISPFTSLAFGWSDSCSCLKTCCWSA